MTEGAIRVKRPQNTLADDVKLEYTQKGGWRSVTFKTEFVGSSVVVQEEEGMTPRSPRNLRKKASSQLSRGIS